MTILIAIVFLLVIIFIAAVNNNIKQKKRLNEIKIAKSKIQAAFVSNEINEEHRDILIRKFDSNLEWRLNIDEKIEAFKFLKKHQLALIQKYGEEVGGRLVNHQYWIGMTEQQLIDCKGSPDKIERQVLKTKAKTIYIYGKKSSGDYFVLENGEVVKFIDR